MSKKKQHENDKDRGGRTAMQGRYQKLPKDPGRRVEKPTFAAGAVLWRGDLSDLDSLEVAVIHRPYYNDWSLPKGKSDPGETLPVTAVREIREETGYEVRLGKLLGEVRYPVVRRTKIVYYWTACVTGGEFRPNEEVDELRWLSLSDAAALLTYDLDRDVLLKARKRFALPATSRILYVRHARAHARHTWSGDDNLRPLDKKGRYQSEMLVPLLSAYQPTAIYSALPQRCQTTVAPLAESLDLPVSVDVRYGDEGWLHSMKDAQAAFRAIVAQGGVSVVCGQGIIIPDMLAWLSASGRLPLDEIKAKKGSVWVLSFHEGELTGADYLESPLPLR